MSRPTYQWLSQAADPPGRWDLRLMGWNLIHASDPAALTEGPTVLDWRDGARIGNWPVLCAHRAIVAVGVDDPTARTRLITAGFSDALPMQVALVELAARLFRLNGMSQTLPRHRRAGPVMLDLLHRDGMIGDKRLGLHPREFALMWRLAETPWRRVSRRELLIDVWQLEHLPETNTLEVHVSRLRSKLAVFGVEWLIVTHPEGGYRLGSPPTPTGRVFPIRCGERLDSAVAIGNGGS